MQVVRPLKLFFRQVKIYRTQHTGTKVLGPPIESRVTLPFPVSILYIHFDNALMIVRVREVIISQVHGDIGVSN